MMNRISPYKVDSSNRPIPVGFRQYVKSASDNRLRVVFPDSVVSRNFPPGATLADIAQKVHSLSRRRHRSRGEPHGHGAQGHRDRDRHGRAIAIAHRAIGAHATVTGDLQYPDALATGAIQVAERSFLTTSMSRLRRCAGGAPSSCGSGRSDAGSLWC